MSSWLEQFAKQRRSKPKSPEEKLRIMESGLVKIRDEGFSHTKNTRLWCMGLIAAEILEDVNDDTQ